MLYFQSFAFNPFAENTYVLYNEHRQAFIIDPGNFNPRETETLFQFIEEKELQVEKILLTHAHIDHILGLQAVYNRFQVPVLLHEIEKEILDRNPIDARRFGFAFQTFEGELSYVKEGETLHLGADVLHIMHLPGHSPGHIAFHHKEQKMIFSGDVLFRGSIGRTDLYKGDYEQLIHSITTKLFPLDADTEVYSGHGHPTQIGFEKEHNPFFK